MNRPATSLANLQLSSVRLNPVREHHAAYIYALRTNDTLNKHLSQAPASIEAQAAWIRDYRSREQAGAEYYFVIERVDTTPCGTVRLYDFQAQSFCWGSWILDSNKTRYAAIESALLVYEMGFNQLGFEASHFDVRKENTKVISFHQKFGAKITTEDALNVYMLLPREALEAVKPALLALIKPARYST